MSIDERDLRVRLGNALEEFTPSPLQLDVVIRRGRVVKARRVIVAAAAAAVAIAVVVAGPGLLRQVGQPSPPATPTHYHVTVYPPGSNSPKSLIASGRLGRRPWRVTASGSAHAQCFRVPEFRDWQSCNDGSPQAGAPAQFFLRLGTQPQAEIGTVGKDVSYLRISLSNGQIVTLRPVAIFGAHYVALVIPDAAAVTLVTAYSARGELAYAVPFTGFSSVQTVRWLRPAASVPDRSARYLIGSGSAPDGQRWSEYAFTGPWGTCIGGTGGGSDCLPAGLASVRGGRTADPMIESYGAFQGQNQSYVEVVAVAPSVSYLLVNRAHGPATRVRAVHAGAAEFCVFTASSSNRATGWAAYSAAGVRLASGSLP